MTLQTADITEFALQLRSIALALREEIRRDESELFKVQSGQFYISPYPDAVSGLSRIVNALADDNPTMLSREGVGQRLIYDVVVPIITGRFMARFDEAGTFRNDLDDPEFQRRIEGSVSEVAKAKWGSSWMETLCVGVVTRRKFEFGGGRFVPLTSEEVDVLAPALPEGVRRQARTRLALDCHGDYERRVRFLSERTTELLLTLAGACWIEMARPLVWPLSFEFSSDIPAMVGSGSDPALQLFRTHERFKFDSYMMKNQGMSGRLSLPDLPERLWGETGFRSLSKIVSAPTEASPLQQRVASCLYWLGESLRPDPDATRIVRLVTAAEALLGKDREPGRQRDNVASVRRSAVALLGKTDRRARNETNKLIDAGFQARNDVLHRGILVRAPIADAFGRVIWEAARATLNLPKSVTDQPQLEQWVQAQEAGHAER